MSTASSRPELQGPRPPPLSLSKQSRKIGKQKATNSHRHQPPPEPVIIYAVSPKKIHVEPEEFMALVQRLTGANSSTPPPPSSSGGGELPPASAEATEWRVTHFADGGIEMPQNSLWNATEDDLNRNVNNLMTNMPSATNADVFSYFYDI